MMKKSKIVLTSLLITSLVASLFTSTVNALEITIAENGSGSSSEVVTQTSSETVIQQTNDSQIQNDVSVSANTGGNDASGNSGESTITTGDVSTKVAVSNSTNFSTASTSCCTNEQTNVTVSGNGSDSINRVNLIQSSESTILISQNAYITNNVVGYANTGNNTAEGNMGNILIQTGDIKVKESLINDPVNIASVKVGNGLGGVSIKIKENGSDSGNEISAQISENVDVFVDHEAEFKNVSDWYLDTGNNEVKDNIGDVDIETGDISFESFIKNFANMGGVEVSCCEEITPTQPPAPPGEEVKPPVIGGGPSGDGGDGEKKEGSLLPSAAATEAGGPGIIGLSDTSSDGARALFFWISLAFIAIGSKIMTEEILPKTSKRKL
jgi:hypothetical protein